MSRQALSWAYEQKTGSPTRKAVLVSLADRHNADTGRCDPAIPRLARETELSESTVKKALAELVEAGIIEVERRQYENGASRSNAYRFPALASDTPGAGSRPPRGREPEGEGPGADPKQEVEPEVEPTATTDVVASPRARPWKVDRRPVTFEEEALAGEVLGYWNRATGQNLRSRDWLAKIVMRIREHPEGTFAEHQRVIDATLAAPWWKGPPSPSVVYGNGAQFERSIEQARGARSVAEILAERRAS